MKKATLIIFIFIFCLVGIVYAQGAKDLYKAVKNAELSATGPRADFIKALNDAETEFDLFKDSQDAKKNPEFTNHIKKALGGLTTVQLSTDPNFILGFVLMEKQKGKGNAGPEPATRLKEGMEQARKELEFAKNFLNSRPS